MAKNQKDFFDELKPWSKIKNDLLATYLLPYFSKITNTKRNTFYVDCFAGQGRFKDGNDGSPFLAVRTREHALKAKENAHGNIELAFIEKEHSAVLRHNLANAFPDLPMPLILDGCFENDLLPLLRNHRGENVFLYVDPFGVKSLQYTILESLANCGLFPSIEILMNFNTFGFLRAARSILAQRERVSNRWDANGFLEKTAAVSERENSGGTLKTPDDLTAVVHGEYWIDIIRRFADVPNGFKEAEKELATAYRNQLTGLFRYVLKMPIGKKDGSIPEYCMYFMTEHPAGCLLMVDNMMNRSEDLRTDVQHGGQMSFFDQDVENELVDAGKIQSDLKMFLQKQVVEVPYPQRLNVDVLKARFFAEHGVVCKSGVLNKMLGKMEASGEIQVERRPRGLGRPAAGSPRASKSFDTKRMDVRISWPRTGG
jgi:three-Cys-motif partner protein